MIHKYEMMLLLSPDQAADDEKKAREYITRLLGENKSTVESVTMMGKKHLAYPINKHFEGVYVLVSLSGSPIRQSTVQDQAKLMPEVLRYLLLTKEG